LNYSSYLFSRGVISELFLFSNALTKGTAPFGSQSAHWEPKSLRASGLSRFGAKLNQQARPEGRGMLFSRSGRAQGFNTFKNALKLPREPVSGFLGLNPSGTNKNALLRVFVPREPRRTEASREPINRDFLRKYAKKPQARQAPRGPRIPPIFAVLRGRLNSRYSSNIKQNLKIKSVWGTGKNAVFNGRRIIGGFASPAARKSAIPAGR
jgi:hypothetical protein